MLLKEVRYFIDKLYLVVMGKTLHRIISKVMTAMSLLVVIVLVASCSSSNSDVAKERMQKMYGENKKLTSLPDSKPSVICSNGTFVGVDSNGVKSFKGIPYAVQPSKLGRWKPSQLAPADSGIYEAYYFGKSSVQSDADSELSSFYPQSEDCLYLNVWTSDRVTDKEKPVMVFIHGGSYGWGGSVDPLYNGYNLVKGHPDVVLVTINYRTGLYGFIDFSKVKGGEAYRESGNLGLLDQVTALKWVRQNISNFGGDPNNVTIFGESAGGGCVSLLPLMPAAKGLFKRVIAQSGSIVSTYSTDECQHLTEMLMKKSGAKNMRDLLALSPAKLKELNKDLNAWNNFPKRDGINVPKKLYEAYANGASKDIDMLMGSNKDEARYWIGEVGGLLPYKIGMPIIYENYFAKLSDADKEKVKTFMNGLDMGDTWKYTEFMNETMFRIPMIAMAEDHANSGGKTFVYYWTYPSSKPHYGACHTAELAYVFGNLNEPVYIADSINPELSKQVQQMWVNFAKTGNPSINGLAWSEYNTATHPTMILGSKCRMENDPLTNQRKLMNDINKYHFNGRNVAVSYNVPFVRKLVGGVIGGIAFIVLVGLYIRKLMRKKKENKSNNI